MTLGAHTLVVYGASERADAALRGLAETAVERGGRVTVLSLVIQESEKNGCCDTRSVLWNDVLRGRAREALARARLAVDHNPAVEFDTVPFSGRRAADTLIREALARDADTIVLADVRAVPIGALQRRRLRRSSPLPVRESAADLIAAE